MGKPVSQARQFDVEAAITIFEYFASVVEVLPSQARDYGAVFDVTTLEPYGVIAGIVPFNWPPIHTAGKTAPALAVGNAIVLKPPEQTPSVVLRMLELISSVLPEDLVHAVPGGGAVGAALAAHPLVGKVSFTGSPVTAASVLAHHGRQPDPDADGTRRQESAAGVRRRRHGQSPGRRDRRRVLQPGRSAHPVVVLIPFVDEDDAVRIANRTEFGLVAAVFTRDGDRALRVSRRIRAGAVFVNNYVRVAVGTGFGGVGHSGFGREHAQETLAEYGYTKTIRMTGEHPPRWSAATRALEA